MALTQEDLKDANIYKKIVDTVNENIDAYRQSKCYRNLCNRLERLYNLIYMNKSNNRNAYTGGNEWLSKIIVPLVREMYLVLRAAMKKNWSSSPFISVDPLGQTPYENAVNSQELLDLNYTHTRFRDSTLKEIYRQVSGYGTAPIYSKFEQREAQLGKQTMYDPNMGYYRAESTDITSNVWNYNIPIKQYFQNPNIGDYEYSDFKGNEFRLFLTDLIAEVKKNPDLYIKAQLEKVIKEAKDNAFKSSNINPKDQASFKSIQIDVNRYVGKLHFKGNELDNTVYYLEIAGEHIYRFHENFNDFNIDGYSIVLIDKSEDYWWSHTPIENVVSYENQMTILMQMSMENAMKQLERYIFYDEGILDMAAINDRHKSSGFIGLKIKDQPIQNSLWEFQGRNTAGNDIQYMMSEAKEAAQRVSVKTDMSRQGLPGGPRNETLGAAQMMTEEGMIQEYDLFDNMNGGFKSNARINHILLQQNLPYEFTLRNNKLNTQRDLELKDVLGIYGYNIETSLTKNSAAEVQRLGNVINMFLNWKGTGNQAFQNIDSGIVKIAREVVRKNNLPNIDPEEIFPDLQQVQQDMVNPQLPADGGMNAQAVPMNNQMQPAMAGAM